MKKSLGSRSSWGLWTPLPEREGVPAVRNETVQRPLLAGHRVDRNTACQGDECIHSQSENESAQKIDLKGLSK